MLTAALARALEAPAAAQAVEEALQVVTVEVGAAEDQCLLRPAPLMLPGLGGARGKAQGCCKGGSRWCLGSACTRPHACTVLAAVLTGSGFSLFTWCESARALVHVEQPLQHARLEPLDGLRPVLGRVVLRADRVEGVRIVGGHARLCLQPAAVLARVDAHLHVVHRVRHALAAMRMRQGLVRVLQAFLKVLCRLMATVCACYFKPMPAQQHSRTTDTGFSSLHEPRVYHHVLKPSAKLIHSL